ncbi:hypothetical protein COCVIDRAFT_38495 [Bipolaris victoriae FI3]|uniref:Peptidase S8/S53 domain-containing protein n=1 Tax=Bipolaris victoriae (strain FI3) TaxID=930091 RepID=W7EPV3_BIPV3|nr:hypothetical protein COCVIDRAFT_38495 [Bipolaris victoriae FI3]
MGWKSYLLPLFLGAVAGLEQQQVVPRTFIVEYEDPGVGVLDWNYDLFKGATVQFNNDKSSDEHMSSLISHPAIKNVWPKTIISIPKHEVGGVESSGLASSSQLVARDLQGNQTYSPHVMTQVDKLHAKGITGKGVKIAIVDTGIDYTHPALGGCLGADCLVVGGYDFVGDAYNGSNTPIPGGDPKDCFGHGTHVAGIIAAQENKYGFIGAAPGASLAAYRVFGCNGSSSNDVVTAGFLRAQQDGAHIITASLGSSGGWSESFPDVIASRIVAKGVIVIVAAGNSGDQGLFQASSPAGGNGVAAIASYENTLAPVLLTQSSYSVSNETKQSFKWAPGKPGNWTGADVLPLWTPPLNSNQTANACGPISGNTTDLAGKVILLPFNDCVDSNVQSALKLGANYIMVSNKPNTNEGNINLEPSPGFLGIGMVPATLGTKWFADLAAGKVVTLDFTGFATSPVTLEQPPNNSTGGHVSSYTSWGPSFEAEIKPSFGAPGGKIISTWPVALGSYAILSGTSMACPLAAAIYALLSNVRNTFEPIELQNLLASTAKPVQSNGNMSALIAPPAQQGAGLIQAYDAAYATTVLSRPGLAFNDTIRLTSETFTISNTEDKDVTYELDVIGAATAYTFSGSIRPATPPDLDGSFAKVDLSDYKVTIPAGGKTTIAVKVTPPSVPISRLPVYGGYIRINGTNGERLSIPYQGIVGDLNSVIVMNGTYLSNSNSGPDYPPFNNTNSTFVFPQADRANIDLITDDLPVAAVDFVFGSPLLNIQIVSTSKQSVNLAVDFFPFTWNGQLDDKSFVPAGSYKFRVSALHIFGDPDRPQDYDVAETSSFKISYK